MTTIIPAQIVQMGRHTVRVDLANMTDEGQQIFAAEGLLLQQAMTGRETLKKELSEAVLQGFPINDRVVLEKLTQAPTAFHPKDADCFLKMTDKEAIAYAEELVSLNIQCLDAAYEMAVQTRHEHALKEMEKAKIADALARVQEEVHRKRIDFQVARIAKLSEKIKDNKEADRARKKELRAYKFALDTELESYSNNAAAYAAINMRVTANIMAPFLQDTIRFINDTYRRPADMLREAQAGMAALEITLPQVKKHAEPRGKVMSPNRKSTQQGTSLGAA